jgi:hypothetical protein
MGHLTLGCTVVGIRCATDRLNAPQDRAGSSIARGDPHGPERLELPRHASLSRLPCGQRRGHPYASLRKAPLFLRTFRAELAQHLTSSAFLPTILTFLASNCYWLVRTIRSDAAPRPMLVPARPSRGVLTDHRSLTGTVAPVCPPDLPTFVVATEADLLQRTTKPDPVSYALTSFLALSAPPWQHVMATHRYPLPWKHLQHRIATSCAR